MSIVLSLILYFVCVNSGVWQQVLKSLRSYGYGDWASNVRNAFATAVVSCVVICVIFVCYFPLYVYV